MKKIIAIIVILVFVGAGGTAAALYTKTWNPAWNPFRPSPSIVLSDMTIKMSNLKAVHNETVLSIEKKGGNGEISMKIEISGDEDQTDIDNPKSRGDLSASVSSGGLTGSAAMEFVTIDQALYLKLTTLPLPSFLGAEGESLSELLDMVKDQWIKIDEESFAELSKTFGQEYQPSMSQEKQKELNNKVIDLFKDSKFYDVKEELDDEEIGGKMTYHYLLTLNKEGIKKLIPDIMKLVMEDYMADEEMEVSKEEIQKVLEGFPEFVDKFFEKVGPIDFEVWIGQGDMYLYRTKFEKEIDFEDFEESLPELVEESLPAEEIGKVLASMDLNLSKFNEPVRVEAPGEFKTIEEVMMNFLTGFSQFPEGMSPGGDYLIPEIPLILEISPEMPNL